MASNLEHVDYVVMKLLRITWEWLLTVSFVFHDTKQIQHTTRKIICHKHGDDSCQMRQQNSTIISMQLPSFSSSYNQHFPNSMIWCWLLNHLIGDWLFHFSKAPYPVSNKFTFQTQVVLPQQVSWPSIKTVCQDVVEIIGAWRFTSFIATNDIYINYITNCRMPNQCKDERHLMHVLECDLLAMYSMINGCKSLIRFPTDKQPTMQ